jgi:hypothetical protein
VLETVLRLNESLDLRCCLLEAPVVEADLKIAACLGSGHVYVFRFDSGMPVDLFREECLLWPNERSAEREMKVSVEVEVDLTESKVR